MKPHNMKYFFILFIFLTITYAEDIIEKPPLNRNSTNKSTVVGEGGLKVLDGQTKNPDVYQKDSSSNTSTSIIPVSEPPSTLNSTTSRLLTSSEKTVHKISAKKGVPPLTDIPKHNVSETPVRPKKPNITEPGGNNSFAPSHSQSSDKLHSSSKTSKVPNINIIIDSNQDNTQKYIVPIVIVILSVPFVAILISVIYKRGAEWWKYRHYRRMDFLINGMYDN